MMTFFTDLLSGPLDQFDAVSWTLWESSWSVLPADLQFLMYHFSDLAGGALNDFSSSEGIEDLALEQFEILFNPFLLISWFTFALIELYEINLMEDLESQKTTNLEELELNYPWPQWRVLFATIILTTGAFISLWYNEMFSPVGVWAEELYNLMPVLYPDEEPIIFLLRFESVWQWYTFTDTTPFSTVDASLILDETLISLFLGLLLLDGSEGGEAKDFVSSVGEANFVPAVVAPLFLSNLGRHASESGALFVKICTIFAFILFSNVMGMLPYSDTSTSSLILTFWISVSFFGSLITLMLLRNGIHYFFGHFLPAGSSLALVPLLVPIEAISYVFRVASLPVRLFANMMAGHTLLKVIVGFSWGMLLAGNGMLIANLFAILILFVLNFLELGVALIQTYIFTILTCIYLKDIYVGH